MSWETFYLICFLVGLLFGLVSLVGGIGHLGHITVPHVHLPHAGHLHVPHVSTGAAHPAGSLPKGAGTRMPWWNAYSIMIFLCWFGAAGYLLTRHGGFVAGVVMTLSAIFGMAGGAVVFLFLTRVLMPHDRELTADDTDVIGVVGRVTSPIREGGTGAIVYQQLGATRSAIARAENGEAIANEEEVYVIRYEKGIAYVRRWEEIRE